MRKIFMNGFPMGENRNIVVTINFKLIVEISKKCRSRKLIHIDEINRCRSGKFQDEKITVGYFGFSNSKKEQ